jgi:hypothetical protein
MIRLVSASGGGDSNDKIWHCKSECSLSSRWRQIVDRLDCRGTHVSVVRRILDTRLKLANNSGLSGLVKKIPYRAAGSCCTLAPVTDGISLLAVPDLRTVAVFYAAGAAQQLG